MEDLHTCTSADLKVLFSFKRDQRMLERGPHLRFIEAAVSRFSGRQDTARSIVDTTAKLAVGGNPCRRRIHNFAVTPRRPVPGSDSPGDHARNRASAKPPERVANRFER